ncbi:unnamed protein product, partial [Fusarium graminearum]
CIVAWMFGIVAGYTKFSSAN